MGVGSYLHMSARADYVIHLVYLNPCVLVARTSDYIYIVMQPAVTSIFVVERNSAAAEIIF